MVSIVESWRIIAYRQARTHNEEMCYKDGNEVLHVILSSAHSLCCFFEYSHHYICTALRLCVRSGFLALSSIRRTDIQIKEKRQTKHRALTDTKPLLLAVLLFRNFSQVKIFCWFCFIYINYSIKIFIYIG